MPMESDQSVGSLGDESPIVLQSSGAFEMAPTMDHDVSWVSNFSHTHRRYAYRTLLGSVLVIATIAACTVYMLSNDPVPEEDGSQRSAAMVPGANTTSTLTSSTRMTTTVTTTRTTTTTTATTTTTTLPDPTDSTQFTQRIARELESKFSQGEVLVQMKRDFSTPDRTLARWQKQDSIDHSLSFSLVHPQMPLEKLWVKHGYFFDGTKCEPLVGSMSDLWVNNEVQHGSHLILTTPEGQRAELLRMMWLRNKKGGAPIHVVFPEGFGEWAVHPDAWAPHEKSVFTARNPFEEEDTIETIPTAGALAEFMEAVDAGSTSIFRVADLDAMSENVMQDYNMVPPRIKFTEVLAMCPLSALLGYVYSVQDIFEDEIDSYRAKKLAEGRKIIEAIRKNIPALASQALSIVEYANTSDDDLEKKVVALKKSTAKHHLAMMAASTTTGNHPQVIQCIQWKDSYLAKLVVVETDLP